jgi:hypothetical protein
LLFFHYSLAHFRQLQPSWTRTWTIFVTSSADDNHHLPALEERGTTMAGGDSAAAEARPGDSSQTGGQQQTEPGAGQEGREQPSPPLPPRPLPPPREEALKRHQLQPLPPLPPVPAAHGVHFGPLPIEEMGDGPDDYVRPRFPRWQKASMGLGIFSLITSVVILGVGIGLGYLNAPYWLSHNYGGFGPLDMVFGLSGSAVRFLAAVRDPRRPVQD